MVPAALAVLSLVAQPVKLAEVRSLKGPEVLHSVAFDEGGEVFAGGYGSLYRVKGMAFEKLTGGLDCALTQLVPLSDGLVFSGLHGVQKAVSPSWQIQPMILSQEGDFGASAAGRSGAFVAIKKDGAIVASPALPGDPVRTFPTGVKATPMTKAACGATKAVFAVDSGRVGSRMVFVLDLPTGALMRAPIGREVTSIVLSPDETQAVLLDDMGATLVGTQKLETLQPKIFPGLGPFRASTWAKKREGLWLVGRTRIVLLDKALRPILTSPISLPQDPQAIAESQDGTQLAVAAGPHLKVFSLGG